MIQYETQNVLKNKNQNQKKKKKKTGDKTNHRLVYQIEMVQRKAARCVTGRCHNTSSVSDMLRSLDWRSLEQKRVDSRLTILCKIRHHLVAIGEDQYLQRGTGRREHQCRKLRADKDYTRFSFFPRTVMPLSPTGSALLRTDLSPLTNGIWELHAGCSCFLHLQLLAKIG